MRPWPGHGADRRLLLAAAVLLAALVCSLGFRALFLGETFVARDLASYDRPAKSLVVPLTQASGGVPLWNPLFASGQPFAANPHHEVFHPLTALLFVLPFEWVFRLHVLLPLLAGALGMMAFLRGLGRSRPAALFGGIAWAFGGYLLSASNLLPILFATSVLPLVLLGAVRVMESGRALDLALLGGAFGLLCLAGEPSTLLATLPLVVVTLWSRLRHPRPRAVASAAARVGAGLALGAALGAAALVPGFHHGAKTTRAEGLRATTANQWSMHPVRALELVTPNVLGHIDRADEEHYWGKDLYPATGVPLFYSLYPGLLAAVLAAVAWARRRSLRPWLVLAVLGYLVALGNHLPLWGLLRRLPLVSGLRYPEKFALLFALPLVVAAAHGFDQLAYGPPAGRRRVAWIFAGVALLGAVLAATVAVAAPVAWRSLALADAARLGAVGATSFVVLRFWAARGRRAGALLACAALALDLGSAGRVLMPTQPVRTAATPPAALRPILGTPDRLLFHLAVRHPQLSSASGLAGPPVPAQWGQATTLEQDFDLTQLRWTVHATTAFFRAVQADPGLMPPLLRRRGVTDVLRFRAGVHRQGDTLALPPGVTSPLELVPVEGSQPFAFAAHRLERVAGDVGWLEAVRRLGEEAARTACVDPGDAGPGAGAALAGVPLAPAPASVRVMDRGAGRVELEVDAAQPGPAFVAINQTWDEGWQTTLDDHPVPLVRTDIDLSGLVVPAGKHRVLLVYRERAVQLGLAMSLLAALVCLGLVFVGRSRRVRAAGS